MLTQLEKDSNALVLPGTQGNLTALYAPHFGLNYHPFAQVPDRHFYFLYDSLQQVVNTIFYALHSGEGMVKVTGVTGVGKTFLMRNITSVLGGDFFVISITNPNLTPSGLLRAMLDELGMNCPQDATEQQLTKMLNNMLFAHYARTHSKVLLCIDDAQKFSAATLDVLHVISDFETRRRKLVQIVLMGQPELDEKLKLPRLQNVLQRIGFSETLSPLTKEQTAHYVEHRLGRAGAEQNTVMSAQAIDLLYEASAGVPRIINTVMHKAMMLAFGAGIPQVLPQHIEYAIKDTEAVKPPFSLPWYCVAPFVLAAIGGLVLALL